MQGVGTVIQDLCGGQYVSQVKAAGAPQSDTTQPFTLLTLDILPASVQTISGAISRFTEVNTLEGEPPLGSACARQTQSLSMVQDCAGDKVAWCLSQGVTGESNVMRW